MAELTDDACCTPARRSACCEPREKADCCGRETGCGCHADAPPDAKAGKVTSAPLMIPALET
jgi:hypothetical protein